MKHYLPSILIVLLSFYACTGKNNPSIPWNETGYRLDSTMNCNFIGDTVYGKSSMYFYSVSSLYYDSVYDWYQYDGNHQYVPMRKTHYKYDSKWNVVEQIIENNNENKEWIKESTEYYVYNQEGKKIGRIYIHWDDQGEEFVRYEYQYEYDSLGNIAIESSESVLRGRKLSRRYTKYDRYYTGNRVDSIYTYQKEEDDRPYELYRKTIVTEYDSDIYVQSIDYLVKDNQFVPSGRSSVQYDSHGNMIYEKVEDWKNDEWRLRWTTENTYSYVLGTDLIEEYSHIGIDYYYPGTPPYSKDTVTTTTGRYKNCYTKL